MNKVKTSLSYIVLVLLAIVIIASCLFLCLNNSQTQNIGVNDNLVTTSTGSIYSSSFDYLEDGSVPSGYTSNYTNIYTGGGLSGSTNYKMTSDAEFRMIGSTDKWTQGACDTSTNNYPEYSGTLDGCGHTLTINVEYKNNSENGSTCYAGFLTGLLSGTIKNLTIRVNFYWRRGISNSAAIKGDSSFYIGAVCGAITGTLQNVKIILDYDGTGFTASDGQGTTDLAHIYYYSAAVFISPVAGKAKGATFKNVTVDVATNVTILTHKNSGLGGKNNYSFFGYLAGASEGTTNFINTTIRTTDGNVKQVIISDGGTVTDRLGLYVGKIEGGTTTFNGVDFGELNITNSSFNSAGYFTGECKDASNISVTNVYYRNTTNNAMQNNKYWSVGTNESYGTISNKILYNNIPESQFGFLKSDSNNNTLWIYCPNSGFAEGGTFVKSITIGSSSTSLYREASLRKEDGYYKFTKPTAGPISRETGAYHIWEISSNTAGKTYDTENVTLNNIITEIKHSSTSKVFPDSGTFFNDTGDYIKSKSDFFSLAVPNNSDYAQVGTYTVTPQNIYSYGWTVDSGSNVYLFKDVSSSYSYTVNKAESILTTPQLYDGGVAEDWTSQVWKTKKSAEEYKIDNRNEARFVYLTYVRTYDDLKEVTLDSSINIQVGKLNGPNYTVTPTLAKGAIQQSGTNGKGQTFDNATYDGENPGIIKHVFKGSSTDDSGSVYEVDYIFNGDVNLYSSYVKCYITINPNNKNYNSETQDPLEYNGTAYNIKEMHNIPTSVTYTYLGPDTQKDLGESAPSNVGNYRANVVEGKDATNYDYQIEASSFTYSIYPKQLTITPYKEYDGTQNSTSNYNIVGIVNGDDINTTFAGTYNSTGVGLDKTFTLNSSLIESKTFANTPYVCLKGNNNYCLVSQNLPNSVIYPKLVSFECFQKQYNGNNNSINIESNNVKTASGFVGSDNVTILKLTGYFGSNDANGSEDVGTNKSFTFYRQGYSANNRGFDNSTYNAYIGSNYWIPGTNYRISVYTYVYDNCIYPAEITISSISKIYDGKNTFDASNISFSGIKVASDTSDLNGKINGTFASRNVGTHAITFDNSKLNNTTYSYYVENGLMGAGYYINGSNFYISNNTYSNTTGTITKATITATLNDTKQLYDSRLDVIYSNNVYNYDFIYNYTGSAVTLSDTWIDYTQIFNLSAPSITGFTDMGYKVVGFKYYSSSTSTTEITNTVGSSSTETIYYIGIEIGNDNQAALDNINIITRVVNTTGAASNYSINYTRDKTSTDAKNITTTIGEPQRNNVPIRLIVAKDTAASNNSGSNNGLNQYEWKDAYEYSSLWNFINSRYYDTKDFYGIATTQKATTYKFVENITYNDPVNVYTILPAYKTINGGGHIITAYMSQGNNETLQYEGYGSDNAAGVKSTPGGTNYVSYEYGNSSYKAGGELVAINYGTMRNFTLSLESYYWFRRYQCINADSAYGMVCGINAGTITNVVVDHTRDYHLVTNASTKVFVGEVAGMNFGTISNTQVSLTAELSIKGSATNVVVGGIAGANINGSITYCKLTSSEAYRYAKEYTTTEVVIENKYYLGILSVDSGITYAVIGGLIGINSNATAKYLIIDSIEKSEFISLATEITYFAAGIAVSDNTKNDAVGKNYNGVPLTVYPSVDGDNAKVGYIYLNFESQIRYKSTSNYIGVAFAKAAQYASTTYGDTQGAVYQGIFISPNFVEDVLQYIISAEGAIALTDGSQITDYDESGNPVYSTVPSYISISSGFAVMGYCDNYNNAANVGKNIRTGARINANEKINCTWGADGKLVIAPKNNKEVIRINNVSITNIDSDKQTTAYSYTNEAKVTGQLTISANNNDEFIGNFNQTTTHEVYLTKEAISKLNRRDSYSVSQSSVGEYTIYVEYFQPIVTISNVFQLAQFMFYDPSATAANVQNWFYETFINGKTANGVSYATMMGVTNSDMATSKDAVFYDSVVQSTFWQAKRAKLNNDIVLDKFVYNNVEYTVDLGWNHQRYFTFAENKELDGNGHKITIVVEDFDTVTKGSLPSTSQFYVSGSGEFASETAVSETNTPARSRKMFLAGGFIGLQRGTLKNINFVYREGSEFTIANININNNTLSRLQMDNCLFVGVVSGYQTGTTDSCTLTLEDDTQVFISKYADEVRDEPYYSNSFMGGYAGFIANGAVISNSKLTMLDNATLGMNIRGLNKTGTVFSGGGSGQHWGQLKGGVGGFAGMSGSNSTIFNATIDGSSSSKMFAITETYASDNSNAVNSTDYSERYPDFENIHVVAGGIVGILTEDEAYNAYSADVGAGNIDGVIYNWKGVTYSTIMHGKDGTGANHRTKVDYIIDGGNCVGVANGKESNIKNLYYTFDISNFLPSKTGAVNWVDASGNSISDTSSYTSGVVYSGNNTNSVVINVKYNGNAKAKVFNLRRDKNNNNLINNVYIFQYARPQAVGTNFNNPSGNGDRVSQQTYGENEQLNSQIKVVHVYEHNDPNNTIENDGISMAKYNQDGADIGVSNQPNKNVVYSNAKITTQAVTSGVGYYEKTDFTDMLSWKSKSKGSNIMVKFTASNSDPSQIIWSVYMTNVTTDTNGNIIDANGTITKTPMYATVTSLAEAQANKEFDLELLRGQGSNMSIYYNYGDALTLKPDENNFREINTHIYMSDNPLMYNAVDDASSVAMQVYDIEGNAQNWSNADLTAIIKDAGASVTGAIQKTVYKTTSPSWNSTTGDKSSWSNSISEGETLKDPGQYKVDYEIKGSEINYNAFVYEKKRSIIFPQEAKQMGEANQTIDTYTIYIAIVPVRLKISSITKVYDGSNQLFNPNQSTITATVDTNNIYKPGIYTCTSTTGGITIKVQSNELDAGTTFDLKLNGSYATANVSPENSAFINLNSTTIKFLDLNRNDSGAAIKGEKYYSVSSTNYSSYLFSGSKTCSPYEGYSKTFVESAIVNNNQLKLVNNEKLPWDESKTRTVKISTATLIADAESKILFHNNVVEYGGVLDFNEATLKALVYLQQNSNIGFVNGDGLDVFTYTTTVTPQSDVTNAAGVEYTIRVDASKTNYAFAKATGSADNYIDLTAKYIIYPKIISVDSATKTYDGEDTIGEIVFNGTISSAVINPIVKYNNSTSGNNKTLLFEVTTYSYVNTQGTTITLNRLKENGSATTGNSLSTNYCIASESVTNQKYEIKQFEITKDNTSFVWNFSNNSLNGASFEYNPNKTYSLSDLTGTVSIKGTTNTKIVGNITYKLYPNPANNDITATIVIKQGSNTVSSAQNAGTYTIIVTFSGTNYKSNAIEIGLFEITKQIVTAEQVTIDMNSYSNVYGDTGFNSPTTLGISTIVIKDKYTNTNVANNLHVSSVVYGANKQATITANNGVYIGGYSVWATALTGNVIDTTNYDISGIKTLSNHPIKNGAETYFILPRQLTIKNVLKTFDNTNSATNALYAVENLVSGDSITTMNATYADVNVGKEISVTFTFDSTPTILDTKYNVVLNNYCLASASYNVGTIIPKTITINNIYKVFDNTTDVNYTTSTVLVKDGSSQLSLNPDGEYSNKNVGKCNFIPVTEEFKYYTVSGNALGAETTVYRIKQSNTATNYMVATGSSAIEGIAYITPKTITIVSVHKVYDENTSFTGATFKISGFLGDITETTAFNGLYKDPNVKYDGTKYNDIQLELTQTQVVKGETSSTVYSIKSGDNINYTINGASGNSVDIEGVGVIIPAVATISEIHKEYNSKNTFSTDFIEDAKDYAIVSYIGNDNVDTRTKHFVISGTLSGKDAGTKYNATINTVTFSFGGVTYNWLYTSGDVNNIANNYCIASTTINTIGEIYQYNIKLDPSTSGIVDGYLTNFRFKNSKDNKDYPVNKNTSGPEYRSSVTYSVSNFYADFKLGDDSGNISAGVLTINGTSISGAVTLNRSGSAFNEKDAGTWDAITLTINTSSLTNYTFTGNTTFSFTILKQNVTAANVTITGVNDYSRVYNGINSASGVTISGSLKGQFTDLDNNNIDLSGLSTSNISITSSTLSSANVGNYTVTSQYNFSSALNVASNGNYNYVIKTGTTTKVYKSGTTSPTYNIAAKEVSLSGTYTKDFDGSNIIEIKIDDLKEILKISVDFAGQGYLAGVYTGTPTASIKSVDTTLATNKNSTASNYKLNTSSITLTINKVNNLVIERQVKNVATGTFQIAIALSKLSSLDYLTKVSEITLTEISDALLYISDNSKGTEEAYNKLKQAISDSFMLKVNDTPDYAHYLEVGQIESIKVTKQNITLEDGRGIELQILEVIYNGYSVLDNETLTDRYEIYMVGCVDNKGTMEVSSALANASTNVSISSSELENGQYNGASNTTGIRISTAEELLAFLKGAETNGYLVNNIYNFNATTLEGKTNTVDGITFASGRVLDGNGYAIQLNNGFNEKTNYAGLFIAENSGTIKNVVFKVGTTATTTKSQVGLVFGNNTGTIENILVSIESEIADRGTSYVAGVAYNNSGSITLTTVAINANVNDLVGFVHTNTGTMNYISSRVKKGVTLDSSYLIAHTASIIAYASVDSANTLYNSGTITKLYGNGNTALSPLQNKYSDNGFVDYYFTSSNKYKTGEALHNKENGTELNMTHYYGTASANTQIAIEVIAPLNRFIWEAFDAIAYKDGVVSKGVQINRAVGLFALEDDLVSKNSALTFTTKVKVENTDKYASIFNPVFGAKTETVISQGTQDNIYEYTGSQITVDYTVGGEKMSITGTEVGVYRTLTKEAGGSAVIGDSYDTQNQEAHVIEGDSGTSTATVELIIVPKILSQGTLTNTKVYDSTSIAETLVDSDNKSGNDSYITGTFTSDGTTATKDVNTGLTVNYNMLTRKVAAVQNGDVYTFVTKKVTNIDGTYEFENINVDGVPFTNNTNISTLNKETLAKAYAKLIDYDKLTEAERKIYTAVDVYDLIITHTTDENTHAVTYSSSQVYFAVSLFNLDGTLNKNYQYMSSTLFNVTSIKATETVKAVASVVNGSITARELQATYNDNDLNQSYRDELVAPKATITQVTLDKLSNLPLSMTNAEKDALVAEINSAIVDTVTVDLSAYKDIDTYTVVDMLGGTATVKVLVNENYIATNNYTATVQAENKKLTLRYFRSEVKENGEVWFKIESLEDIKAIGKEEAGADYTTLKYFVTKNINAKSAVLNQVNITFEGILDGNGKTISNFVLIGETSTGIFNTLSESAQVINLTFADVLIYTTGANATIEVVADTNNGTIDNIKLEGSFVSNGTVTVNGITNTNNDTNSAYVLQTGMNTGITFAGTTNNEVVILRDFGSTLFSVYINNAVSAISNVSESVSQLITSHVLDKLYLTLNKGVVTIKSFRQYWAYINICPWLTPSTNDYSIGMRN